ncbi:MAG: DNA primase [Alphaproteobacteria bacterium]|nr:DNA primase [Alphaproteobacteria bacterium]
MAKGGVEYEVAGRTVRLSSPDKVMFPEAGITKQEVAEYFLRVADGAVRGVRDRPMMLKRFPQGIGEAPFYQKRAPKGHPDWIRTATLSFPSGRTAEEVVVSDAAALLWVVQQGCVDLNPHPTRIDDLDHPDELRIDLDPLPGIPWSQVLEIALLSRTVLEEHGLAGYPKTSGSRGFHVLVPIEPRWEFQEVRAAALAVARELERRAPGRATARWWKEERQGVFVDYNQNAKDRTVASAYSVRPLPDARVSTPLHWDEVEGCDPALFTLRTVPARFEAIGDPHAAMDTEPRGDLTSLLQLSAEQLATEPDAPWPPQYPKMPGEAPRVQPSRAKGRRVPKKPLRTIANSPDQDAALAGLERWKARHPAVVPHLEPADVLVDAMRGRYNTWTRIRVNLEHVPPELHPPEEPPDPDDDPTREWRAQWKGQT